MISCHSGLKPSNLVSCRHRRSKERRKSQMIIAPSFPPSLRSGGQARQSRKKHGTQKARKRGGQVARGKWKPKPVLGFSPTFPEGLKPSKFLELHIDALKSVATPGFGCPELPAFASLRRAGPPIPQKARDAKGAKARRAGSSGLTKPEKI